MIAQECIKNYKNLVFTSVSEEGNSPTNDLTAWSLNTRLDFPKSAI